ncbi:putative ribonuclease H-like domain-containing protein [Tanacetum coccineum]
MVPRTVLTRSGPILVNVVRPVNTVQSRTAVNNAGPMKNGNLQQDLKDKGVIDGGCSRHMTGNRSYLTDYEEIDRGFVAFGGGPLCLLQKPSPDESNLWYRRLGHDSITNGVSIKGKIGTNRGARDYTSDSKNCQQLSGLKQLILLVMSKIGCKCDGKADEGFFIGYSTNSKAFRLFDIDALTNSMNYEPVVAGNQFNGNAGIKECDDAGQARMETVPCKDYILLPNSPFSSSLKDSPDARFKPSMEEENKDAEHPKNEDNEVPNTKDPRINQQQDANVNNTNKVNTVSPTVNAAGIKDDVVDENIVYGCDDDLNMPDLEEIVYLDDDEGIGAEADMTDLETNVLVSLIPTTRIHKDHPIEQIIGDLHSTPQTRRMTKNVTNHVEPKKKVWTLVDLPYGKRAIGTKWVYRNKKDDRGIVIRNKARLVAHGYTQEEDIDYDEVFLAYASFMNFIVYQIDVKSAFLYGTFKEEVYVCQPPMFEDPEFPNKVYKNYISINRYCSFTVHGTVPVTVNRGFF